jgi:cytochrome c556
MIAALDTLQTAKRLKEAGFDDAQAEALTGVLRDAREAEQGQLATKADANSLAADIDRLAAATKADINSLAADIDRLAAATKDDINSLAADIDRLGAATKADIDRLRADTKTDFDGLRAEFRAEFALIRSEMEVLRRDVTIRLGGMIVVATGVLLAAKFFG